MRCRLGVFWSAKGAARRTSELPRYLAAPVRALCILSVLLIASAGLRFAFSQQPGGPPTFKSESKVVLVDAIVTDKHGQYIHNLTKDDFRVYEDGKEQQIVSFTGETTNASAQQQKHYFVLLFDDTSLDLSNNQAAGWQMASRQFASKFVDAARDTNSLIAVTDYTGYLRMTQPFTDDPVALKAAVMKQKFGISHAESGAEGELMERDWILSIRSLARSMASLPGRKIIAVFTAGFPLNPDNIPEVTAAINECNRANVAVYPLDARQLVAPITYRRPFDRPLRLMPIAFSPPAAPPPASAPRPPAPAPRPSPSPARTNPSGGNPGGRSIPPQTTSIIPQIPKSVSDNQQVMYALADGTGGFAVVNTNDLLAGLERIQREQNEYYLLGYVPPSDADGKCHSIKVKVASSGVEVRARSGYCSTKPLDVLSASDEAKQLEAVLASSAPVKGASMQLPYFYVSAGVARLHVSIDVPQSNLEFHKDHKRYVSQLNVLGVAYRQDNSVAARFSDSLEIVRDEKPAKDDTEITRYEKQMPIAPGVYRFKVAFQSGRADAGKLESPLKIDPFDGTKFAGSAVTLSTEIRKLSATDTDRTADLLEDKTVLVAQGMEVVPSGSDIMKKSVPGFLYTEFFEPHAGDAKTPLVAFQLRILERNSGKEAFDAGMMRTDPIVGGNPVVPVAVRLPTEKLTPGSYRVEISGLDSTGARSAAQPVDFDLQP